MEETQVKTIKQPHTITRQEFRDDPGAALRRAEKEGALTIVDENDQPRMIISGQNECLLHAFEGVVRTGENFDDGTTWAEVEIKRDEQWVAFNPGEMLVGMDGKRVRITVEVIG